MLQTSRDEATFLTMRPTQMHSCTSQLPCHLSVTTKQPVDHKALEVLGGHKAQLLLIMYYKCCLFAYLK